MAEKKEFLEGKQPITFVDLFAGAGGISEGFLQAFTSDKYFSFVLASDINSNCELTHRVRYNHQLGLDMKFITEDIMSDDFIPHLQEKLQGQEIDVVTGGPSCQSFSLAGSRKKFDKRDNLFMHYLGVIRLLRPKYFVMENVTGILTKDKGKFKDAVIKEIRSIIDDEEVPALLAYLTKLIGGTNVSAYFKTCLLAKVKSELFQGKQSDIYDEQYFKTIDNYFKQLTKKVNYKVSKSDEGINTIRHGLTFLKRSDKRKQLTKLVVEEKTASAFNKDGFIDTMNDFVEFLDDEKIIIRIINALNNQEHLSPFVEEREELCQMLRLYSMSLDECFEVIYNYAIENNSVEELEQRINAIHLYQIDNYIKVNSSDYGVPQNRERVLFIGCRKDQKKITTIPATLNSDEKVSIYEAISDLDFIKNGELCSEYKPTIPNEKYDSLIRKREVSGHLTNKGQTYIEWSRNGRLNERFEAINSFYVKKAEHIGTTEQISLELFNHQTSNQSEEVLKRLEIIAANGSYDETVKKQLEELNLVSGKLNYTVLNPAGQSPTVVTMPDDFIHYSAHRCMTVREMARLQSFDDSFVFQGKRTTGGDARKNEVPQYTMVGNAVPPLMARAIGETILNVIE